MRLPLAVWREGRVRILSAAEVEAGDADADPAVELMPERLARHDPMLGLAALRLDVEHRLGRLAEIGGVPLAGRTGAGAILQSLAQNDRHPADALEDLRSALALADRAVHGTPVPDEEARSAVITGERALAALERHVWSRRLELAGDS